MTMMSQKVICLNTYLYKCSLEVSKLKATVGFLHNCQQLMSFGDRPTVKLTYFLNYIKTHTEMERVVK